VTLYTVDYVSVPLTTNSFASPPAIGSSVPNAGTFTTLIATGQVTFTSTGAAVINVGTTSERPATPQTGMIRYNSTISKYEGYAGAAWGQLGGGATGGGTDQVIIQNGQTVTTDYTITTSNNAGTFGPVSIDTGITVTVPTGSTWTVV